MDTTVNPCFTNFEHHNELMDNVTMLLNNCTSTDNSSKCLMDEDSLSTALAVFYSLIFIVGLVGNVFALYVFLFIHVKRNSVQIYLLNAAIADLLLIFCLPFRIMYHLTQEWKLGIVFCKVVGNLFYMNMYISIVLLGLISMDRYVKVKKSQRQRSVPRRKCSIRICCCLWASAGFSGLFLITTQSIKDQSNPKQCFHYTDRKDAIWQAAFNYFVVLVFWIVLFLLIISYVKIGKNLRKISRERAYLPNSGKYNSTAYKSFFVLFIVSVCFVPYHTFRIAYIATQLQKISCYWMDRVHKTNEITLVFSAFNSCLDPVMYFLLSSSIRKTVFRLLCRGSQDAGRSESNTSDLHLGHTLPDSVHVYSINATPLNQKRNITESVNV
ncbi:probable G-protein coupled receptor 34 [Pseudophryne corroboree]|uniref:probable G-protein coupled receptor 34 n=1 Tax=Pseudophryne corroboree TaxID=495146 RepID=UPI003081B054